MPSGAGRIFRDFAGWTSAHGIPHIGASHSITLTVFWTIIWFASFGMFGYQMSELVRKYVKFEVTVQTKLKFEERTFPAITMCNLNPYMASQVNKSEDLAKLMDTYQQFLIQRKTDVTDPQNIWKIRDANDTIMAQSIAQTHMLFIGREIQQVKAPTDLIDEMTYQLSNDTEFKSGFVLDCTYNSQDCELQLNSDNNPDGDFVESFEPLYGSCFQFNPKGKYKSTRAGPLYGLSLLTLSNQKEYLPLTESAGIRVAIHSQDEVAFPDAFGYNAAAGFTTSFGIKYIRTKRLPYPHGECRATKPEVYYYTGPYTVEGCFRSCSQKIIVEDCGCGDPRYELPLNANATYCATHNETDRDCVKSYTTTKNQILLDNCKCPQPCDQASYSVTVSTSLWPSQQHTPDACQIAGGYVEKMPWEYVEPAPTTSAEKVAACKTWFGQNTMLIEAYYERMNYQQLQEYEAYSFVNLVSDMGGQLGLWLGISVITVVEFLSLLLMCCVYCVTRPDLSKLDDLSDEE